MHLFVATSTSRPLAHDLCDPEQSNRRKGQMSSPITEPEPERQALGQRLGLPVITGRGNYVASTIVDSLANGLVFAFLVVYFDRVTGVGLGAIGVALSVGRLLALPIPVVVGPLMDRLGGKTVVVAGNIVSCTGMIICAVAANAWQIAVAQLLVQTGTNAYWTCSRDLVNIASHGEQRSRWFGMQNALRNVGNGFGAAATAGALATLGAAGLRGVIFASAISFLVAGALLLVWQTGARPGTRFTSQCEVAAVSYLAVLRDTRYLRLLVVNLAFVLAAMVLPLLVTLWTIAYVGVAAWWAGGLVVLNTAIIALVSTVVVSRTDQRQPRRLVQIALALNVASFGLFALANGLPELPAIATLLAAMIVYTLAEVLGTPYMNELAVALVPPAESGRYHAAFQLSWSLGMAIAPAAFTTLLALGSVLPWLCLSAVCILAIPLAQHLHTASHTADSNTT